MGVVLKDGLYISWKFVTQGHWAVMKIVHHEPHRSSHTEFFLSFFMRAWKTIPKCINNAELRTSSMPYTGD